MKNKPFNISVPLITDDYKLFKGIIEQGIDSHLQGFTDSKFEEKLVNGQPRLVMDFGEKDLPILIRRLEEIGMENEDADRWAEDIAYISSEEE